MCTVKFNIWNMPEHNTKRRKKHYITTNMPENTFLLVLFGLLL